MRSWNSSPRATFDIQITLIRSRPLLTTSEISTDPHQLAATWSRSRPALLLYRRNCHPGHQSNLVGVDVWKRWGCLGSLNAFFFDELLEGQDFGARLLVCVHELTYGSLGSGRRDRVESGEQVLLRFGAEVLAVFVHEFCCIPESLRYVG